MQQYARFPQRSNPCLIDYELAPILESPYHFVHEYYFFHVLDFNY